MQTDEETSVEGYSCNNVAETLAEINRKLGVALTRVKAIEEINKKEVGTRERKWRFKSKQQFDQSKQTLTERVEAQQNTIRQLNKDVNQRKLQF